MHCFIKSIYFSVEYCVIVLNVVRVFVFFLNFFVQISVAILIEQDCLYSESESNFIPKIMIFCEFYQLFQRYDWMTETNTFPH